MGVGKSGVIGAIEDAKELIRKAQCFYGDQPREYLAKAQNLLHDVEYSLQNDERYDDCDCEYDHTPEVFVSQSYVDSAVRSLYQRIEMECGDLRQNLTDSKKIIDALSNRVYLLEARRGCDNRS